VDGRVWTGWLCAAGLWLVGCQADSEVKEPSLPVESAVEPAPKIDFSSLLSKKTDSSPPRFSEVAGPLGIDFQYYNDAREARYFFPEILGGGFACLDYDLDGWPDLFCANGRGLPLDNDDDQHWSPLYRNLSGQRFVDVTQLAELWENGYAHGCAFGDLNADGFDDIAVAGFGGITVFLNQGDGSFLKVDAAALPYEPTWSVCPVICDLDNDGLADLLVVNYVRWNYEVPACTYDAIRGYCGPGEFAAVRDYVFINQGDGRFVEQGQALGFTGLGKGLAVAALDWDHDLRPEIYIANDLVANFYYRPDPDQGNGYVELADNVGLAVCVNGLHEASMSVTPGDFLRNGWADIFVTNYYKQKNTLYSNQSQGRFRDVSFAARTHQTGEKFLGFGAVPLDYDKDGWLDLYVGNGHVLGPEHIPNQLSDQILRNDQGAFDDVSHLGGDYFQLKTLSRGVATFDFDQDLDTDIVVNHLDRPISLLRNESPGENRAIALQLCSPQHQPLEGSRIELTRQDGTVTLPFFAGGSYFSDSQREWIIGVGQAQTVDKVVVYWRDGRVDTWENLETQARWQFQPGRKLRL